MVIYILCMAERVSLVKWAETIAGSDAETTVLFKRQRTRRVNSTVCILFKSHLPQKVQRIRNSFGQNLNTS